MNWVAVFTKHGQKDAQMLAASGLKPRALTLLNALRDSPFQTQPPMKCWSAIWRGPIRGASTSNIQHRLVYPVLEAGRTVKVLRMGTHCD